MNSKYFLLPALVLAATAITGCSDDNDYDFPGSSDKIVYTTDFSGEYKIVQTPAGAMGAMSVPLTAKANSRPESDVTVTYAVDNDLIDAYNEEHGTSYLPLPAEALMFDKTNVTIPAGALESMDTTYVGLTEDADILATLTDERGYIIPVRMASVNGGGAKIVSSMPTVFYLTIGITNDAVNHDGTLADSKGTAVEDWTGWSISATDFTESSYGSDGIESVFDGDYTKYWEIEGNSDVMDVIVDMGKAYRFDAIESKYNMYGYYEAGSFKDGQKIYTSMDGTNWSSVGEVTGVTGWLGSTSVIFWGAIEARYIKFEIKSTSSWSGPEFATGYFTVYAL